MLSLIALRAFGLVGLAVASTFVSAVALWANTSRLNALLRYDTPSGELVTRYQVVTMVGIGAATAVAPYLFVPSWQFVISAVAVSTLAVIIPAVAKDPALATVRLRITGMFPGMAHPSRR